MKKEYTQAQKQAAADSFDKHILASYEFWRRAQEIDEKKTRHEKLMEAAYNRDKKAKAVLEKFPREVAREIYYLADYSVDMLAVGFSDWTENLEFPD